MGRIYRHLCIGMCPAVQRYLQFCINKCTYHFTCLPFRLAINFSTGVHQTSEAGSASVTFARRPSTCLLGWLAHLGGFTRDGEFPTGHMSVAPSWMEPKLSKVRTPIFSGIRVHQDALLDIGIHRGPPTKDADQGSGDRPLALGHNSVSIRCAQNAGHIQYMAPLVPRGQLHFQPIQWWTLSAWDQT